MCQGYCPVECVLILILLEVTQIRYWLTAPKRQSLNPYSTGSNSNFNHGYEAGLKIGLNPYSTGSNSNKIGCSR